MTQLQIARKGKVSKEMRAAAMHEPVSAAQLRKLIAGGKAVIPANAKHKGLKPIAIGQGLRTKVNANLGTSPLNASAKKELEKMKVAVKYGADTVMDLSIGGNIDAVRKAILRKATVPVGTVPIYQAFFGKRIRDVTEDNMFSAIEKHCSDGIDFITVHSGVSRKALPLVKKRLAGAVSRGGSLLLKWIACNGKENPLYKNFDYVLEIAKKNDVTLSLGDGLRPGCIKDATDSAQLQELRILGKLGKRAKKKGVQAMIEGPGHIPLNEIERNVKMQKRLCNNAPFYVLGPIVTDVAPGYDHITSAIGGALAAYHGADFLCYVTPSEHLSLPSVQDVKEGVIAARIAGHAADIAKGLEAARQWDDNVSSARKKLDWKKTFELVIDKEKAKAYRKRSKVKGRECTMCGEYCALKGL
ncbi:MAG: phosphomethylpyrimidine synthase ThiC [Candidatus Diapherotrites archaeon]|uniref:Phosphomethylpyrimidine synthase n=1 Tax=Candidatus Iainarchaeum sp. TaxID=3101447 RepID=A0A938YWU7_9ARCH|nr:phosphomethylpyrimidine synthase ThiC [Candidatus Diapherotrites archaeon]